MKGAKHSRTAYACRVRLHRHVCDSALLHSVSMLRTSLNSTKHLPSICVQLVNYNTHNCLERFLGNQGGRQLLQLAVRGCSSSTMARYKVYTKTGDGGESSLFNGNRRSKADPVFAALGDIDELNASLGVSMEHVEGNEVVMKQLVGIQSRLFDAGSAVATPRTSSSETKVARAEFPQACTEELENWIDNMDESLPQLTSFILPSGGKASAQLHMARAICRRAERAVALLPQDDVGAAVPIYLNRLSDYLFTAARYVALPGTETTYKKGT